VLSVLSLNYGGRNEESNSSVVCPDDGHGICYVSNASLVLAVLAHVLENLGRASSLQTVLDQLGKDGMGFSRI
jgi:hypothetical protein